MKKSKIIGIIVSVVVVVIAILAVLLIAGKKVAEESQLKLVVENKTDVDIGAFAIIYPENGKQYGLDKIASGDTLEEEIDWDFEKNKELNWAVYNMAGELYMESKTTLKDDANVLILTFEGTGEISSVETTLKVEEKGDK